MAANCSLLVLVIVIDRGIGSITSRSTSTTTGGSRREKTASSQFRPNEMPLFAYAIGLGQSGRDLVVDLIHTLEPEGVQMKRNPGFLREHGDGAVTLRQPFQL
jgi:hypothetical protein